MKYSGFGQHHSGTVFRILLEVKKSGHSRDITSTRSSSYSLYTTCNEVHVKLEDGLWQIQVDRKPMLQIQTWLQNDSMEKTHSIKEINQKLWDRSSHLPKKCTSQTRNHYRQTLIGIYVIKGRLPIA